jgi:hypothetical protein
MTNLLNSEELSPYKHIGSDLPKDMNDIFVTYKKTIYFGVYQSQSRVETVTKRGFYSKIFENYSIPPDWQYFNKKFLPHGFGGDKLQPKDVICWQEIIEKT